MTSYVLVDSSVYPIDRYSSRGGPGENGRCGGGGPGTHIKFFNFLKLSTNMIHLLVN
jgi:hypothetical protein